MSSDKVTARPWMIDRRFSTAVMGGGHVVAACGGYSNNQMDPDDLHNMLEANARHIVKCVNNHERLVEALRDFKEWFSGVGLDHIPNDVYHHRGGFDVAEKARKLLDELDT